MCNSLISVINITQISIPCLFHALIYVNRMRERLDACESGMEQRVYNIGLMLAQKMLDDNRYRNKTWARIYDIPLKYVNIMEREFLDHIGYDTHVTNKEYHAWVVYAQELSMDLVRYVQEQKTTVSRPFKSGRAQLVEYQHHQKQHQTPSGLSLNPTMHAL
jgi:Cyclin